MKKNYRIKKTISMKQFIAEMGEDFTPHMKDRLMDLEVRTVLTRSQDNFVLDVKHVEHTLHNINSKPEDGSTKNQKEYAYSQFIVKDGSLYFSEKTSENPGVMEAPVVNTIYDSLNSEETIVYGDTYAKKVDDSNIDTVIDTLLQECPDVSQSYLDIISKYYV